MSQTALTQITQYASLAASFATVLTLGAVWLQIRAASRVQAQDAARQLYAEFLTFAANNPEAVDSATGELKWGSEYEWSVYLWLTALESGWLAFEGSNEWKRRIASFARQNEPYLRSRLWYNTSKPDDVKQDFDPQFGAEVDRACEEEARRRANAHS